MSTRSLIAALALSLFLLGTSDALAQMREVNGQVASATGEPVPGATVTVKGTTITSLTREDGTFTIIVPSGDVVLVVAFLGYRTHEVTVADNQSTANVTMELDPLRLEEVVVTGQATGISRQNLANAIATVSAEEFERAPSETIEKAVRGKVPGAMIETNSGAPGGGVQVRLRGASTINALSTPLYVVDGVIISDVVIPSNQVVVTKASTGSNPSLDQDNVVNRVVDVNPGDIERVEILKGAAAAAIYGQKASNGVVIITTKRGRPGRPRFQYTQRFGFFDLSETIGSRSFETVDEAVDAYGSGAADFFDPATGLPLEVFDQEELLAHRNDLSFESSLSVSGGTEATRYFASALWKNDEGIVDNTGFEKQSIRVNLQQLLGRRAEISVNTNVIHSLAERGLTNNDNSGTSTGFVLSFTPEFADLQQRPDGTFPDNAFQRSNPLQTAALMSNEEDVWRLISGLNSSYDLIQGRSHNVTLLGNVGVDYFSQTNELFFPPELQFEDDDGLLGTSLLSESNNVNFNIGINGVYTYTPASGSFTSTTSAGFSWEDRDLQTSRIESQNLNAGQPNVNFGTNITVREQRAKVRDMGYYLQEELLTLDDRLLLTAGGRLDRSSTIGDEGEFHFFPKASASYRFPNLTSWLDDLKFRIAWGQSGNLPLYGQKFTGLSGDRNVEGIAGLLPGDTIGDAAVKPERQNEVELGLDATLADGRGSLEFTVYQKNITDLLIAREVAPSTGFEAAILNGGELRVRGIEAALSATPVQTRDFSWLSRTVFFLDRSKILDNPVPTFRAGGFGTNLGSYEFAEGTSATAISANVICGTHPTCTEGDSVVVREVGNANPDFQVGFSNEITWGNFNLYGLFDWRAGGEVINLTLLLYDFGQNAPDHEEDPQFVESIAGTAINDSLTLGERRVREFSIASSPQSFIESATYVKLRELSLSYTIPPATTARLFGGRLESVRLTLSGRNLLTFTDYSGLDPEVNNFGNQAIARNYDVAPFPPSRSYWFSVDLTF